MSVSADSRFQSGQTCSVSGWYEFDGYVAGPPEPLPIPDEVEVPVMCGDRFPLVHDPIRSCYWRLVEVVVPMGPPAINATWDPLPSPIVRT